MSLQCLVHNFLTSGFVAFQIKYFLTNSILKARLFYYGLKENNQNCHEMIQISLCVYLQNSFSSYDFFCLMPKIANIQTNKNMSFFF